MQAKKITAYHESGHAILFHVLPDVHGFHHSGIGAAGYTMPERDDMFMTKGKAGRGDYGVPGDVSQSS